MSQQRARLAWQAACRKRRGISGQKKLSSGVERSDKNKRKRPAHIG
jgi:hypothetical protein